MATGTGEGTPAAQSAYAEGTLGFVRKRFIEDSGRYDLVMDAENGDFTDNGADFILNAAQRSLDRMLPYHKTDAWLMKRLSADQVTLTFKQARYIRSVWIVDSDSDRKKLTKKTFAWLREEYESVPISEVDSAEPEYWAPHLMTLAPEQEDETESSLSTAGVEDLDFLTFGSHFPLKGIVVMPPPDQAYTIEVLCAWYQPELNADDVKSFWTVQHPELLIRAAQAVKEVDKHRNSTGYNDFMRALQVELQEIYFDLVAEEAQGEPEDWVVEG